MLWVLSLKCSQGFMKVRPRLVNCLADIFTERSVLSKERPQCRRVGEGAQNAASVSEE